MSRRRGGAAVSGGGVLSGETSPVLPGHKVLAAGAPSHRVYAAGEIEKLIGDRLAALDSRLAAQGSRLVILHYPAPHMEEDWKLAERVIRSKNIPFVSPLDSMPLDEFEDIYHLNPH